MSLLFTYHGTILNERTMMSVRLTNFRVAYNQWCLWIIVLQDNQILEIIGSNPFHPFVLKMKCLLVVDVFYLREEQNLYSVQEKKG